VVPALFFMGVLNNILSQLFKDWLGRREKKRQILLELNQRMESFKSDYFMLLVVVGTRGGLSLAQELRDKSTNEFLERHDLEFPQSIRDLLTELRTKRLLTADDIRDGMPRGRILEKISEVSAVADRIRTGVERLIR